MIDPVLPPLNKETRGSSRARTRLRQHKPVWDEPNGGTVTLYPRDGGEFQRSGLDNPIFWLQTGGAQILLPGKGERRTMAP